MDTPFLSDYVIDGETLRAAAERALREGMTLTNYECNGPMCPSLDEVKADTYVSPPYSMHPSYKGSYDDWRSAGYPLTCACGWVGTLGNVEGEINGKAQCPRCRARLFHPNGGEIYRQRNLVYGGAARGRFVGEGEG